MWLTVRAVEQGTSQSLRRLLRPYPEEYQQTLNDLDHSEARFSDVGISWGSMQSDCTDILRIMQTLLGRTT